MRRRGRRRLSHTMERRPRRRYRRTAVSHQASLCWPLRIGPVWHPVTAHLLEFGHPRVPNWAIYAGGVSLDNVGRPATSAGQSCARAAQLKLVCGEKVVHMNAERVAAGPPVAALLVSEPIDCPSPAGQAASGMPLGGFEHDPYSGGPGLQRRGIAIAEWVDERAGREEALCACRNVRPCGGANACDAAEECESGEMSDAHWLAPLSITFASAVNAPIRRVWRGVRNQPSPSRTPRQTHSAPRSSAASVVMPR
jgi:hypothetical protein